MDRFTGLLLGTAVGDSLGLPTEGLRPRRARRLYAGPLRQRLVGRWGMLSDDTEHACMTAQALLADGDDPARFARALAWKLRWWLAALPPAIGLGTLRALLRLWVGFSPSRSGVRSAGNGAVMRAPIIGAWFDDPDQIAPFVAASTAITHRDPRAHAGALAVAIAAHHAVRDRDVDGAVLDRIRARVEDRELLVALARVETALVHNRPPVELAHELGLHRGVTGYVHHTVPMCLHAWLRSPRGFRRAVTEVIELGGDTDTTGAIVGALAGASAGEGAIPAEWLAIVDAPRSITWIRTLARRLDDRSGEKHFGLGERLGLDGRIGDRSGLDERSTLDNASGLDGRFGVDDRSRLHDRSGPVRLVWPLVPLRNAVFLAVVLVVGLRRLLPPY